MKYQTVAVCLILPIILGSLLIFLTPKIDVVERKIRIQTSAEHLWDILMNVKDQTSWREDVKAVQLVRGSPTNPEEWIEKLSGGREMRFHTEEIHPQMGWRISFQNNFMRGEWEGALVPVDKDLMNFVIKESVEVHHPIFRTIFHFSGGLSRFADAYIAALKRRAERS